MRKFLLFTLSAAAFLAISCRTNESPEKQVGDVEITAQVKSKLAAELGLSTVTNISVNSTNGVVTLAGQVDNADLKAKAETAAKSVPKVVKVINNLQVASAAAIPTRQAEKVLARFS
jgi:osmotically-inducible protein OsmY